MHHSLCNINSLYNGGWVYNAVPLPLVYSPWSECPHFVSVLNTTDLNDHLHKYSCVGKPYFEASYHPLDCQLLSLKTSSRYIAGQLSNKKRRKLVFIGDSLTAQLYISASCFIDHKPHLDSLDTVMISDLFLRNDIPCDDRCISNQTFLHQTKFMHPCWSCQDGIRRSFDDFDTSSSLWHHQIPFEETFAIVINSGAWYNNFQGVFNSSAVLAQTLNKIGPMFASWKRQYGIHTYWVSLPPHDFSDVGRLKDSIRQFGFEWRFFVDKDQVARRILEPHGVTFLDIGNLTLSRKTRDSNSSSDGLHWCNPGMHSVPTFINQALFHLMAVQQLNATAHNTLQQQHASHD